jgi:hypothetical protein
MTDIPEHSKGREASPKPTHKSGDERSKKPQLRRLADRIARASWVGDAQEIVAGPIERKDAIAAGQQCYDKHKDELKVNRLLK